MRAVRMATTCAVISSPYFKYERVLPLCVNGRPEPRRAMLRRDVSLVGPLLSRGSAFQKQTGWHLDYFFLLTKTKRHPLKARLLAAMKQNGGWNHSAALQP